MTYNYLPNDKVVHRETGEVFTVREEIDLDYIRVQELKQLLLKARIKPAGVTRQRIEAFGLVVE